MENWDNERKKGGGGRGGGGGGGSGLYSGHCAVRGFRPLGSDRPLSLLPALAQIDSGCSVVQMFNHILMPTQCCGFTKECPLTFICGIVKRRMMHSLPRQLKMCWQVKSSFIC